MNISQPKLRTEKFDDVDDGNDNDNNNNNNNNNNNGFHNFVGPFFKVGSPSYVQ